MIRTLQYLVHSQGAQYPTLQVPLYLLETRGLRNEMIWRSRYPLKVRSTGTSRTVRRHLDRYTLGSFEWDATDQIGPRRHHFVSCKSIPFDSWQDIQTLMANVRDSSYSSSKMLGTSNVSAECQNGCPRDEEHPHLQLHDELRRDLVPVSLENVPRLVLVAATPNSKRARAALPRLLAYLSSQPDVLVAVDKTLSPFCPDSTATVRPAVDSEHERIPAQYDASEVDLVICIGGDGLIFHVLHKFFPTRVPPFVPFNMGSLGFLTPFDFGSFEQHIAAILCGTNKTLTTRMRLKCVVSRCGSRSACVHNFHHNVLTGGPARGVEEFHVLNELVIDRGPAPYLSNLEVLADDCPVTRVQGDGLIVATPTGSTAYSLSSGGSMVHPSVPAILFTPICPHSLSFRPVLFPDHVTLQIKVPKDSRATAWVSFDGRHRMELMKGDKVVISASPWAVPTFNKKDSTNDWFASVSQCLRWNERVIQGASETQDCESIHEA